MKRLHAFLLPLHNEGVLVQLALKSFKDAGVSWKDVFLVDDGSEDDTLFKVFEMGFPISNIFPVEKNVGKTMALIMAFNHFELAKNYEWINTGDGDTLIAKNYMEKLIPILNDVSQSTAAIASRVCSIRDNWNAYTSYRTYEYALMQQCYKRAQGYINCVTVLPGCGTTIRTSVFEKLSKVVRPEILTEDFLWTIRIHKEGLGKVLYANSLRVYTQDPDRMESYWKQNARWFGGGWQVYREEKMWQIFKSKINAETSFLFIEGLFFSLIFVFAFIAAALRILPTFVHYFFWFDIIVFSYLTLLGAIFERDVRLLVWMPYFYILRIVKCIVYLHSFIKVMVFKSDRKIALKWNKVERY